MTPHAERRAFLTAFEKSGGNVEEACAATGVKPETHQAWMKDREYAAIVADIQRDLRRPPPVPRLAGVTGGKDDNTQPDPKHLAARGVKRRGRPPRSAQLTLDPAPVAPPAPVQTEPQPAPLEQPEPPSTVFPGQKGYVKIYDRGEQIQPPEEPAPRPQRPPAEPEWVATSEITVSSDVEQRKIIDEYGELDRRMQIRAMESQRYDALKKAIKTWFDQAPADADGVVEGDTYLLHLSARERERKIRSLREVADIIGMDRLLELATIPVGVLENILGKAHVERLTIDARTGSRRIKAIPKRAAAAKEPAVNGAATVSTDGNA